MSRPRQPTTKELESSATARRHERELSEARLALIDLRAMRENLSARKHMGKLITALSDHIEWLIAEHEVFQQAAAELWADDRARAQAPDCVAPGPTCVEGLRRRD